MHKQSDIKLIGRRYSVLCRDGIKRTAVRTSGGWFETCRGSVQLTVAGKRRTVSGFIDLGKLTFAGTGTNAGLIPLTSHKPRLANLALRLIKATAYGKGVPGYGWDLPSDHSTALAAACRKWEVAWHGTPELGWIATAEFKRIKPDVLPRLALFFDRLSRFQAAAGE